MLKIKYFAVLLLLLPIIAGADDPKPPKLPSEITTAKQTIRTWTNTLVGKTEDQVVSTLGKDFEKESWDFKGKAELKLKYVVDEQATLLVLFLDEKVLKVSFQVLSHED